MHSSKKNILLLVLLICFLMMEEEMILRDQHSLSLFFSSLLGIPSNIFRENEEKEKSLSVPSLQSNLNLNKNNSGNSANTYSKIPSVLADNESEEKPSSSSLSTETEQKDSPESTDLNQMNTPNNPIQEKPVSNHSKDTPEKIEPILSEDPEAVFSAYNLQSYTLIPPNEIPSIINKIHLEPREWILDLTYSSSKEKQDAMKQKWLLQKKYQMTKLIPFMKAADVILCANCAEILGISNCLEAFPAIVMRIQYEQEKNVIFISKLIESLSYLSHKDAPRYFNQLFMKTNTPQLLKTLVPALLGKASPHSQAKAKTILLTTKDLTLQAELYRLLADNKDPDAFTFARSHLKDARDEVKISCLNILSCSQDPKELDFILGCKRDFYKSVPVMLAFLKTKILLEALHLTGDEKLNSMEQNCIQEKNKNLLAWLALYSAKQNDTVSDAWSRDFLKRHRLIDSTEYLIALKRKNLPVPKKETTAIEADTGKTESRETLLQMTGKLRIDTNLSPLNVWVDSNQIDLKKQNSIPLSPGMHTLKASFSNETISKQIDIQLGKEMIIKIHINLSTELLNNSKGISMKLIPNGQFTMGNDQGKLVAHPVLLKQPLYFSIYEITNSEFELFQPKHKNYRDERSKKDDQPAVSVTWYEAVEFCNWLSKEEHLSPCYDKYNKMYLTSSGYRLPTEAEWEYAARGGLISKPYVYPWGNELIKENIYFANGAKKDDGFTYTAPVGSFTPNCFGLFDMSGNVSEWCYDWYDEKYYLTFDQKKPAINPIGPKTGYFKVSRGGSWQSTDALQCAYREYAHPTERSNTRGFRVCRNAKQIAFEVVKDNN
ncbi:MAG: SUMF1/EgtB/PvdO family nonheme iron enzyme [Candidatus Aureabacteria bacterium]|nr:SUMF1/EgtB/PvdO family nonheme iron enzyme [Candidatus Auribacterota bacterium]